MRRALRLGLSALLLALFALLGWSLRRPVLTVGVAFSENSAYLSTEADMVSTAQAYVDWHNGGEAPIRLRLVGASYRGDPRKALEKLRSLGASVVLGASVSDLAQRMAPVADELGLPLVSPTAQTEALSGRDDFFFRVQQPLSRNVEGVVALLDHLDARRVVAFVSRRNGPYGRETAARVARVWGHPVEILVAEEYSSPSQALPFEEAPSVVWVVASPETSFWLCRRIHSLWPQAKLILSTWSLSTHHGRLDEIEGLSFFFVDNVNPWADDESPFEAHVREAYRRPATLLMHYTAAAMDLIVAAGNGPGGAADLRRALAPRLVERSRWSLHIDRWGDAQGRPPVFWRTAKGVEEIDLP